MINTRLALIVLCVVSGMAAARGDADTPSPDAMFAAIPSDFRLARLEAGAPRMVGQPWTFAAIPAELKDLPAVLPTRGPSNTEPGMGYSVKLTRPAALYLAVHRRGRPTLPDGWKPTGLVLNWSGHADDVYARIADAGPIEIPAHDGFAGGLFGVPHLLAASDRVEEARALIASPKPPSRPPPPPFLALELADSRQAGLYVISGQPLKWRFVLRGGIPARPIETLSVAVREEEGTFADTRAVPFRGDRSEDIEIRLPKVGLFAMTAHAMDRPEVQAYRGALAAVPPPEPPSAASPWGVMRAARKTWEAPLARLLGASWVRHSNWDLIRARVEETGSGRRISADASAFVEIAREYRAEGLHVMASLQMVPRELSSRPDATAQVGDAGPLYARVRPRDWMEWETFIEDAVRQCGDLIDYWEIGNEPNMPNHYWAGTAEEFALLVRHTGEAIRRARPGARILIAGFTLDRHAGPFLDRLLSEGCGPYMDLLSVHSLYAKPVTLDALRLVLERHGLGKKPVWSTEPKHVLPIRNFAEGVAANMHFLLINPSPPRGGVYSEFQNLAENDGSATRWGVAYAICAKIIGAARLERAVATGVPDAEAAIFRRGDNTVVLAMRADEAPRGAVLRVRVQTAGAIPVRYTDLLGHEKAFDAPGDIELPLDRSGILFDAADIVILGARVPDETEPNAVEVSARRALLRGGFELRSDAVRDAYAVIYAPASKTDEPPTIVFPFQVAKAGSYEIFAAIQWYPSHAGQLVSDFAWGVDDGPLVAATSRATLHWRRSTRAHLRFGEADVSGVPSTQVFARLGVARQLTAGSHSLIVQLTRPRAHDGHFSMEIEGVALRPVTDDRE